MLIGRIVLKFPQKTSYSVFPGLRILHQSSHLTGEESNMSGKKTGNVKGEFLKGESAFRKFVTADGSSGFKAEADRYHIYCGLACPWANRVLIMRNLKGLQDVISLNILDWHSIMGKSWAFNDKKEKCTLDTVNGKKNMEEVYKLSFPEYKGRYTTPVLWDKKTNTIVNNESSEIIRMFNTEFGELCKTEEQRKSDYYPEAHRKQIDEYNTWLYPNFNNGVYRAGFATTQEAYDIAVRDVFETLDKLEEILSKQRFLCGDVLTEADIRLFTTLIRFDSVYVGHFKCNKKRIVDYPNLWNYTRDLYQRPEFKDTIDQGHIQKHYQHSHTHINPTGIVSIGPEINYDAPHDRDRFSKA